MGNESIMGLDYADRMATITFNRPERRNAFNEDMWTRLEEIVSKLRGNLPRVILLRGKGDIAFSAGFDVNPDNPQVSSLIGAVQNHDASAIEPLIRRIRGAIDSLVSLPVPIIAAINGNAYGGGAELAIRSDIRVMDPNAVICFSEVKLGLMTDWGGGVALTRLVGPSRAADIILTARKVGADDALSMGLVNYISRPGKAYEDSKEIAEKIASNGPRAVRAALDLIRHSTYLTRDEALELESTKAIELIASGECYHGISAFLSGKEPDFPDIED